MLTHNLIFPQVTESQNNDSLINKNLEEKFCQKEINPRIRMKLGYPSIHNPHDFFRICPILPELARIRNIRILVKFFKPS